MQESEANVKLTYIQVNVYICKLINLDDIY